MAKQVLVVLSDGFEDVEAIAPVDILNRCGVEVTIASLASGPVRGAYGTTLVPHAVLNEVANRLYDGLVLPGGKRNAQALAGDPAVVALIVRHHQAGRLVAAICASPGLVLAEGAKVLVGRKVSSAEGFQDKLTAHGAVFTGLPVTVDGNLVTANGPGAAMLFGFQLAEYLVGRSTADELASRWGVERQRSR